MFKPTIHDEYVILAALRVASEAYANDAANSDNPRLANQFRRQSDQALALADKIEDEGIVE